MICSLILRKRFISYFSLEHGNGNLEMPWRIKDFKGEPVVDDKLSGRTFTSYHQGNKLRCVLLYSPVDNL